MKDIRIDTFQTYLSSLSPNDRTIWRATKHFKKPTAQVPPIRSSTGSWERTEKEKAKRLETIFTPHTNDPDVEIEIVLNSPFQKLF